MKQQHRKTSKIGSPRESAEELDSAGVLPKDLPLRPEQSTRDSESQQPEAPPPEPRRAPRRVGRWVAAISALVILTLVWPSGLPVVATALGLAFVLIKIVGLIRLVNAEEVLEPSIEERGHRCPFCREDFAAGEVVESCAACRTVHHAECREEFGACATFACEAPMEPGRRFAIAQDLIVGWEHPEAVEIDGEVATPFPRAADYDPVTGLRRLGGDLHYLPHLAGMDHQPRSSAGAPRRLGVPEGQRDAMCPSPRKLQGVFQGASPGEGHRRPLPLDSPDLPSTRGGPLRVVIDPG